MEMILFAVVMVGLVYVVATISFLEWDSVGYCDDDE